MLSKYCGDVKPVLKKAACIGENGNRPRDDTNDQDWDEDSGSLGSGLLRILSTFLKYESDF